MKKINCDVLIIGKGLAGTLAAINASSKGAEVLIVSEKDCASNWAQGGIVYKGEGDPELLKKDIIKAGCQLNNINAVDKVCLEGPKLIDKWLKSIMSVPFEPEHGLEAAHSSRRILHVKDKTGAHIMKQAQCILDEDKKITQLHGNLIDLLQSDRHSTNADNVYAKKSIHGAYFLDQSSVFAVISKSTILATGGYSGLYQHSTGPKNNIGAGISAAHRAGARTLHLEFEQFHPTTFYAEGEPQFLISEALRGEGAVILNAQKKEFVDSMAPRDVVARAIHKEMSRSGLPYTYLDASKISDLKNKFPSLCGRIKKFGLDPSSNLLPIVPAAHYSIGGVWTDTNAKTNIDGLWAAGECACTGLHGANRLASTSLLEAVVFGLQASNSALKSLEDYSEQSFEVRNWSFENEKVDEVLVAQDWTMLKQTMWNYVGLVRSKKRLTRASKLLNELREEIDSFYKHGILNSELLSLRHAILLSTLCLYSTLSRSQSIGTHYLEEE